jgi:hypothetical protein
MLVNLDLQRRAMDKPTPTVAKLMDPVSIARCYTISITPVHEM